MTADEREQMLQIVLAHQKTIAVWRACAKPHAISPRIKRDGVPSRGDLTRTIKEAEDALDDLRRVRAEVGPLKRMFAR